ncbi:MAG: DoxX family protein, partial [Chloroflexota bacterium]|nr:DoxX family protein [Chloroflexota bacterium]
MKALHTNWKTVDFGVLLLRLAVGIIFFAHGSQKLFGAVGGGGSAGPGKFFASFGLNPGVPLAVLSGLGETVGGILMFFGIITPLAA